MSGVIGVLVGEGGGGLGVSVGEGGGGLAVLVGGTRVGVDVTLGRRVFVDVMRMAVGDEVKVGVGEDVLVKKSVGVESSMLTATACTVSAETVFRLEMAISTMLAGSSTIGLAGSGLERAMAEVIHNKLIPKMPAATTPSRLV